MLTWTEDVEVHALHERGWSISAIARHLDRDRVRAYINGERTPGRRRDDTPDPLAPFEVYLRARFTDDPHIWASALYDEVTALGYQRSYVTFARQLRLRGRSADDTEHASYNPAWARRYWQVLSQVNLALEEFAARFSGKGVETPMTSPREAYSERSTKLDRDRNYPRLPVDSQRRHALAVSASSPKMNA